MAINSTTINPVEIKNGCLLKALRSGQVEAVVHQCNCFHSFGAGIAKDIKRLFPTAYEADLATAKADTEKLGTFSTGIVDFGYENRYVYNMYNQYFYGQGSNRTDYPAMRRALTAICVDMVGKGLTTLGLPYMIGCGLAGGSWSTVSKIIQEVADTFPSLDIILYRKV